MFATHGVPEPHRWAVSTTGGQFDFSSNTAFLQINPNSGVCRVYFTKAAFDADVLGGVLPGTGEQVIELDGGTDEFYEGPAMVHRLWLGGIGGNATVTVVGYLKKV